MADEQTTKRKKKPANAEPHGDVLQPSAGIENQPFNTEAEYPYPNARAASAQDEKAQSYRREQKRVVSLTLLLNAFLVITTIALAIISVFQWRAMNDALDETRRNRELEYRAYVAAKAALFQPRADNPAWGTVSVVTINTGRTPGSEGTMRFELERRDASPPDDTILNPSTHQGSRMIFTPNIEYQTQIGVIGTSIADTMINPPAIPIPSPTPILPSLNPPEGPKFGDGWYAYGVIDYKDIFGKPHWTKFCFFIPPKGTAFLQCPTFNDAN